MLEAAGDVPQALAVAGQERVDVADRVDPVAEPRGDAGDHHPAVGMAGEDEAVEAGFGDLLADVVDMVAEGNAGVQFAPAACRARASVASEHGVPRRLEVALRQFVALVAAPGAMDQHVVSHSSSPSSWTCDA